MKHTVPQPVEPVKPGDAAPPARASRILHDLRRVVRHQSRVSLALTAAVGLALFAILFDPAMKTLADGFDPTIHHAMAQITRLGNSAWPLVSGLVLLGVLLLALRHVSGRQRLALLRARGELLFFLLSVAISGAIANLLKNLIGRARPNNDLATGIFDLAPLSLMHRWASFPSGHATTATAMMVALALIWPRHALGFVTFGLLVALSRALVGVHWLSDVVAGVALGAAVTVLLRRRMDHGRLRQILTPQTVRLVLPALLSGTTLQAALWRDRIKSLIQSHPKN